MISRRRKIPKKILANHMEELERTNRDEEKQIIDEVANIKRSYIKKYGKPKTMTKMPIKGVASEDGQPEEG